MGIVMKNLNTFLAKFRKDESGATMIEYTLLAGLVSIVAILSIQATGPKVAALWTGIAAALPTPAAG
jgi:pilus assembly protein Flp/PilA